MKRCINPNCGSTYLFGSSQTVCPFCHQPLVENGTPSSPSAGTAGPERQARPSQRVRPAVPTDLLAAERMPGQRREEPLVQRRTGRVPFGRNRISCRGRVTEIEHHELFTDVRHKLMHTLFRGEPYQFSIQSVEYTIRVENLTDGLPTEVTDFCLYGNYLGRLQVGDEVTVKAKDCGDRRVVSSLYNETTGSEVRPGLQVSPWLVRGVVLAVLLTLVWLICQLVWLFQSGAVAAGAAALLMSLMPVLILIIGFYLLFRSVFPRRRRRRRR